MRTSCSSLSHAQTGKARFGLQEGYARFDFTSCCKPDTHRQMVGGMARQCVTCVLMPSGAVKGT